MKTLPLLTASLALLAGSALAQTTNTTSPSAITNRSAIDIAN